MKRSQALGDQSNARKEDFMEALSPPPRGWEKELQQTESSRPIQEGRVLQMSSKVMKAEEERCRAEQSRPETRGTGEVRQRDIS